jgi:excisionase family DNA binding protein
MDGQKTPPRTDPPARAQDAPPLADMLTLDEVAQRLGVPVRTVRRLIADRQLAAYNYGNMEGVAGRRYRVASSDLAAFLAERRVSAIDP